MQLLTFLQSRRQARDATREELEAKEADVRKLRDRLIVQQELHRVEEMKKGALEKAITDVTPRKSGGESSDQEDRAGYPVDPDAEDPFKDRPAEDQYRRNVPVPLSKRLCIA